MPTAAPGVHVLDHGVRTAHQAVQDAADLRAVERALDERDEAPSVIDASSSADPHGERRHEVRSPPVRLTADGRERDQRVRRRRGRQREPGDDRPRSRRRRAASRGEYDEVWICAATNTAEKMIPVKVIIPAASAPMICSTTERAIGRCRFPDRGVEQRQAGAERDGHQVRDEHR